MADARELAWATDDPLDPQKGWGGGRQPTRLKHERARFLWSVRISKSPTRAGVRIGLMEDMFFRTESRSATSLSPGGRALRMRGFAWRQGTSKRKDNIRKRFSSSGIAKIQGALHTGVFVLVLLPQALNADLRAHLRAGTSPRLA